MPMEDVIVRIHTISDARGIGEMQGRLENLQRAGQDTTEEMKALNYRANRLGLSVKRVNAVFRPFQMQLLSTLFLGMAVASTFKSLLTPTLNITGVFDILSNTLAAGLLPTGLMLLDWSLKFMEVMLSLDPATQSLIGNFLVFGVVAGTLVSWLSQAALGLAGLKYLLAGLTFNPLILQIAAIGVAVGGLIYLWKNWQKISASLKLAIAATSIAVGVLLLSLSPFYGWLVIISGAMIGIIALFKNWGTISDWIKTKWQNTLQWILDKLKSIIDMYNKIARVVPGLPTINTAGILGSRQSGGFIPQTGMYKLHAGETVVPASQNNMNFNPTINIYGSNNNVDMADRIRNQLDQVWANKLARLAR